MADHDEQTSRANRAAAQLAMADHRLKLATDERDKARSRVEELKDERDDAEAEQSERCRWWVCCVCALKRTPPARFPEWRHWAQHGWETVPHHEPPRSCGGRDRDTVPMCIEHHAERHAIGEREFCARHGIDLRELAAAIHQAITKETT